MKQRVDLSTFSFITTIICIAVFIICFFINDPPFNVKLILAAMLVLILIAGLFYMPLSIAADKYAIYVKRSLKIKTIPMKEVKSVRLCPPTMGAIRVCGSGGFMGYWGWFRERDLGRYFAYYGRSSDCFLVELKDGHKYVLGCRNPQQMVDYINSNLSKKGISNFIDKRI